MASERAEKVAADLERTMNTFDGHEDAAYIVGKMLYMHRTLNQAFTSRIILPFVRHMAKNLSDGQYDPRNKAACEMCRVMWDAVKEKYDLASDDEELSLSMI